MFYDHGYLNFIAFILASFKLLIIQAAMNIDYEQFLALDGGRKTEEAWNKQAFPKPSRQNYDNFASWDESFWCFTLLWL